MPAPGINITAKSACLDTNKCETLCCLSRIKIVPHFVC